MSSINLRKTQSGNYAAEFQRNDGFGYETRYYRGRDLADAACRWGENLDWLDQDNGNGDGTTMAESIILARIATPFRII